MAQRQQQLATLDPAFERRDVTIVMSADNGFAHIVSSVLESVRQNASEQRNYDVIVLNTDISDQNQRIISKQCNADNFSVRFFDVSPIMSRFGNLRVYGHFKIETYFRLLIPEILPWCDKALYLDADITVLADVAELYDTDLTGHLIGATHDADEAGQYNGYDPGCKDYLDNVLKIDDPYSYFQAGIILMNLEEFRATYTSAEMLEFAASYPWSLLDQDVLNRLCQGRVRFVDMAWNTLMDWQKQRRHAIIGLAPQHLRDAYEQARLAPKIVHYAGPDNKPWQCKQVDFGEHFWHYADMCPFASEIREQHAHQRRSLRRRRTEIANFWIYHVVMPVGNKACPAGTKRRAFIYRIYSRFGSWGTSAKK